MQNTPSLSERLDATVTSVIRKTCIAMFTAIALLMVVNVLNRFFPILNLSWFDEIVEGLFAWLVFLGSAELWRENEHFTVTFLPDWLRGTKKGDMLEILLDLTSMCFIGVFTYYAYVLTGRCRDITPVLEIPKYLLYLCMPLSGLIMLIHSLRKMLSSFSQLIHPQKFM